MLLLLVSCALLPLLCAHPPASRVVSGAPGCARKPSSATSISGAAWALVAADDTAVCAVHDPTLARDEAGVLWVVSTDAGAPPAPPLLRLRASGDGGRTWATRGAVFERLPAWAAAAVPAATGLWAPDLSFVAGRWLLFYSVSSFGSQRSAIGLAMSATLAGGGAWVDAGAVLASAPGAGEDYNAIDPSVADDGENVWLVYGSFWGGIHAVPLDAGSGKPAANATPTVLARRPAPDALEGAFLLPRPDAYYLFVSWDYCCRGVSSNYSVHVGRSPRIDGPYVDRAGAPMLDGGGSLFVGGGHGWAAGGGPGFLRTTAGVDPAVMVLHAYDGETGAPYLQLIDVAWGADGWPAVATKRQRKGA